MNAIRLVRVVFVAAVLTGCSGDPGSASPRSASPTGPNPGPTGAETAIPQELIGTWTTTITDDDLAAAGVTGGEVGENRGVFTMTFASDGTWSMTQETDVPVRWPVFRGTMTTTGPNGFRQVTRFPADFAGDLVDFTWSIDDGALRIKVVNPPDHILPIIMETHPWQRSE
jgi:hypothetical protein